jgi:transglutaminase-like putative cysteine protease
VITFGTLLLMGLALLLFLLLPRMRFGVLAWNGLTEEEPIIGFSDTVSIGSFGRLRTDLSKALTLSTPRLPVVPEVPLRIRGLAFTSFDGRTWGNPPSSASALPRGAEGFPMPGGRTFAASILMEPIGHPVLMLPEGTGLVAIRSNNLKGDAAGNVLLPRIPRKPFQYDVRFDYPPPPEPLRPGEGEAQSLMLPGDYSRIAPLVAEAVAGGTTRREKAARLETWLRTRYAYTVDLPPVSGDPVEAFLLTTRRGHCEYFASAMAVMARLAGVPSRVVNGFVAWEYVDFGGFYVVRQRDAHTWVQCLLPEGWVDFDPTPSIGSPSTAGDSDPPWRRWSESLSFAWQRWIYGFRVEDQQEVYGEVGKRVEQLREETGMQGRAWLPKAVAAILGVAAAALFLWGGGSLVRRRRIRATLPVEARLYTDALRMMARCGWPKGEATAPQEYVDGLAAAGAPPEAVEPMRELTGLYLEARFSGRPLGATAAERGRGLVRELRKTRRRTGLGVRG